MTELPSYPDLDQYQVASLTVHDAAFRALTGSQHNALAEALRANGVDADITWRVDHLLLDAPALRIWQYIRTGDWRGLELVIRPGSEPVPKLREPFLVPVRFPVPGITELQSPATPATAPPAGLSGPHSAQTGQVRG